MALGEATQTLTDLVQNCIVEPPIGYTSLILSLSASSGLSVSFADSRPVVYSLTREELQ